MLATCVKLYDIHEATKDSKRRLRPFLRRRNNDKLPKVLEKNKPAVVPFFCVNDLVKQKVYPGTAQEQ